jgi:4-hydroxy-3-methylbut-2-enyl diphosphate reductase
MKVRLARTAGFCMGVRRAMDILLDALRTQGGDLYTCGPIIHNPQVIQMLRERNVKILEDIDDFHGGTVVIRAHGITPKTRKRLKDRGAVISDATCPHVMRAQSLTKRYSGEGYSIIIIGDKGHSEVTGLQGFAAGDSYVIGEPEEIASLPELEKACVVAQTTQNRKKFDSVVQGLKSRYSHCVVCDTICNSTDARQKEARKIAQKVDAMVVVGGRNSANTCRLVEICRETGTPTYHIETERDLSREELKRFRKIGITAGASTPNWLINAVVEGIETMTTGKKNPILEKLSSLVKYLLHGNLYLALGAACLTDACCVTMDIRPRSSLFFISFFYILSMHVYNSFIEQDAVRWNEPARVLFLTKHQRFFFLLASISVLFSIVLSSFLGFMSLLIVLVSVVLGIAYRIELFPLDWSRLFRYRKLKDIPGSKDIFLALAWAVMVAVLPAVTVSPERLPGGFVIAFLFAFILTFIRSVLVDIKDIQGDRIVGNETIPIVFGIERTKVMLLFLNTLLVLLVVLFPSRGWSSPFSYWLLIPCLYTYLYLYLYHRRIINRGYVFEAVTDGSFLIAGLIANIQFIMGGNFTY